jgi:hypothetical protein
MSTVAQKLGIKPDTRIAIDGLSVDATANLVGESPDGVVLSARDGSPVDQLILVAESLSDVASQLSGVWYEIVDGGRLWVWYRKGASRSRAQGSETPLHRDTLQAVLAEHGMDGVTLISIDDTWSSMRVRKL